MRKIAVWIGLVFLCLTFWAGIVVVGLMFIGGGNQLLDKVIEIIDDEIKQWLLLKESYGDAVAHEVQALSILKTRLKQEIVEI